MGSKWLEPKPKVWSLGRGLNPRPAAFSRVMYEAAAFRCLELSSTRLSHRGFRTLTQSLQDLKYILRGGLDYEFFVANIPVRKA